MFLYIYSSPDLHNTLTWWPIIYMHGFIKKTKQNQKTEEKKP